MRLHVAGVEMSEDPVKYEYQNSPGIGSTMEQDFSRFDRTLSPEPTATQIRIEALRAAATVAATQQSPTEHETLSMAKQFAAYLESGE